MAKQKMGKDENNKVMDEKLWGAVYVNGKLMIDEPHDMKNKEKDVNLKIFTKPNEKQSVRTKKFFKHMGIQFHEVNVNNNLDAINYLLDRGFLFVPVTEYKKNKIVDGFQPLKLRELVVEIKSDQAKSKVQSKVTSIDLRNKAKGREQ